jgi:acyl-CoA thioester hydrolase
MADFKFYFPIQVRYGDLDPQWHVNNAKFLTYIEQARFAYLVELQLWDGKSFIDLGLIIADVHVSYKAPIQLGQKVRVGVRVSKIGTKSLTYACQIEDEETHAVLATAEIIGVSYNYHTHSTQPVPEDWRRKISQFEGLSLE